MRVGLPYMGIGFVASQPNPDPTNHKAPSEPTITNAHRHPSHSDIPNNDERRDECADTGSASEDAVA